MEVGESWYENTRVGGKNHFRAGDRAYDLVALVHPKAKVDIDDRLL